MGACLEQVGSASTFKGMHMRLAKLTRKGNIFLKIITKMFCTHHTFSQARNELLISILSQFAY